MNQPIAAVLCLGVLLPAHAAAQGSGSRKWEVEIHAGGLNASNSTDGTAALPSPGDSFTTAAGRPSRRVSSWYFGDGALLFNQVLGVFPANLRQRITPLDPVLGAALVRRQNGFDIGGRLTRILSPRFAVEMTVDYSPAKLELVSVTESALFATRGSFESSFNALLATAPALGLAIDSRSTVEGGTGGQVFTTGTLNVALKTTGQIIPYVSAGGGVLSRLGDPPRIGLEGNYRFQLAGLFPINETDTVRVRAAMPDNDVVGVVGGGVKYLASARWGIRADARVYLSANAIDTLLDATPSVASVGPVNPGPLSSATTPSIQFSNSPPGAGPQSNLTGPAISDFRAFEATGTQSHFVVAAGLFWRF